MWPPGGSGYPHPNYPPAPYPHPNYQPAPYPHSQGNYSSQPFTPPPNYGWAIPSVPPAPATNGYPTFNPNPNPTPYPHPTAIPSPVVPPPPPQPAPPEVTPRNDSSGPSGWDGTGPFPGLMGLAGMKSNPQVKESFSRSEDRIKSARNSDNSDLWEGGGRRIPINIIGGGGRDSGVERGRQGGIRSGRTPCDDEIKCVHCKVLNSRDLVKCLYCSESIRR